jgi:hypothetical protein
MIHTSDDTCAICQEPLNDSGISLPGCGHSFHLACVLTNAQYNVRCALCRCVPLGVRVREGDPSSSHADESNLNVMHVQIVEYASPVARAFSALNPARLSSPQERVLPPPPRPPRFFATPSRNPYVLEFLRARAQNGTTHVPRPRTLHFSTTPESTFTNARRRFSTIYLNPDVRRQQRYVRALRPQLQTDVTARERYARRYNRAVRTLRNMIRSRLDDGDEAIVDTITSDLVENESP